MSSPNNPNRWWETWWPLFVIIYGITFAMIVANWKPTT